jgi:hypothetical protein
MRQYRPAGPAVSRPRGLLAALALSALLLAGCASDDGGGTPPAAAPSTPAPSVRVPPVPSRPGGQVQRVVGRVEAGVEAGCKVLVADGGGGYLLIGGPAGVLTDGARVEVRGTVEEGLITTCQQGRPFKVISAKPG